MKPTKTQYSIATVVHELLPDHSVFEELEADYFNTKLHTAFVFIDIIKRMVSTLSSSLPQNISEEEYKQDHHLWEESKYLEFEYVQTKIQKVHRMVLEIVDIEENVHNVSYTVDHLEYAINDEGSQLLIERFNELIDFVKKNLPDTEHYTCFSTDSIWQFNSQPNSKLNRS